MSQENTSAKLALFLGAGASTFAGYRTFNSFPDLMLEEQARRSEGFGRLDDRTHSLLQNIKQVLVNVERKPPTHDNFMWILDSYTNLLRNLRVDGELKSRFVARTVQESDFGIFDRIVRNAIHEMTATTIKHYSKNHVKDASNHNPNLYYDIQRAYELYISLALLNDMDKPFLPVFTANYDLLMEDMFSAFGSSDSIPLVDGFDGYPEEGVHWDSTFYTREVVSPRGLYLHRIHGCVCWYWHEYGDPDVYFHREEPVEHRMTRVCAMFPGREKRPGVSPHVLGFRKLYHTLLNCEVIIFIGFSFRDDDVMRLLLAANVQRQSPLRIMLVDPNLGKTTMLERLRAAERRSPFPGLVPEHDDVFSLRLAFGKEKDFDSRLLSTAKDFVLGENPSLSRITLS